jgi:2-methylcitrate dehydratase PrpD
MDTGLKLHACCRYNQSAIDATIEIMKQNELSPHRVKDIQVDIFKAAYPLVVEPWEEKMNPNTDVQAQFSLPYTVALAIVKGRVSFEEFYPEVLNDPSIHDMMKRVRVVHDLDLDSEFPRKWPTRVTIQTADHKKLSQRVDYPKGDVANPLAWEELITRFNAHSGKVINSAIQAQIVDIVRELQDLKQISQLSMLLCKAED